MSDPATVRKMAWVLIVWIGFLLLVAWALAGCGGWAASGFYMGKPPVNDPGAACCVNKPCLQESSGRAPKE
jgi:hypothetical protein